MVMRFATIEVNDVNFAQKVIQQAITGYFCILLDTAV
jgi:hypothetical protein